MICWASVLASTFCPLASFPAFGHLDGPWWYADHRVQLRVSNLSPQCLEFGHDHIAVVRHGAVAVSDRCCPGGFVPLHQEGFLMVDPAVGPRDLVGERHQLRVLLSGPETIAASSMACWWCGIMLVVAKVTSSVSKPAGRRWITAVRGRVIGCAHPGGRRRSRTGTARSPRRQVRAGILLVVIPATLPDTPKGYWWRRIGEDFGRQMLGVHT